MSLEKTLIVTTPSDREIAMSRVFDAPRALVWDAHTKPELVRQWLGVRKGWTFALCEIDLRVGGTYRWVWRSPSGVEMGMGGTYREISAPERLVSTEKFDQAWYPGEAVGTLTLVEKDGRTTLTSLVRYASKEARDAVLKTPMTEGVGESYDGLERMLTS